MSSTMYRSVTCLTIGVFVLVLAGCHDSQSASDQSPQPGSVSNDSSPSVETSTSSTPGTSAQTSSAAPAEKAIAPEKNPPGDIPDTQVFINYKSAVGGYTIDVPEGWARSEQTNEVKFADKYDGEEVVLTKDAAPPTIGSVKQAQVPQLMRRAKAVKIRSVKMVDMAGGSPKVCVTYTCNSDPNPVTGRQIRQEAAIYYYYVPGRLASLTVWAPEGADNVDQWKRISESFKWK